MKRRRVRRPDRRRRAVVSFLEASQPAEPPERPVEIVVADSPKEEPR
jgi:hypothetical protein